VTASTITFASAARHNARLAKIVHVHDGRIVRVEPAPQAGQHRFRLVQVDGLEPLMAAVRDAASRGEIAVRGQPVAPVGRRAIHPDAEKGPPGLEVVPRRWVGFDWDKVPIRPCQPEPAEPWLADDPAESWNWALPDPLLDPELGASECLRRLPPAFRDTSCGWQVSASAGFKPDWRLRTWHWLSQPCTGAELKTWLKPAIDRNLVDDVTLVEAQPHYLAVTVLGGPDPCPQRFGVLQQAGGEVIAVPDIAAIARRQQQRDRAEHERARPRYQPAPAAPAGDGPEARLQACLDTIRGAADGTKHKVYYHEAARARAICDRYDFDWQPWRQRLMEAYEATLPAGEADRRRKNSIEGVMDWLDRRPAA
jgi:hypothetical protein